MINKTFFIDARIELALEIIRNHPHLIDAIEQTYNLVIEDNEDEYLEGWK